MPNPRAQQPLSFDQIIKDAKSLGVPAQALLDALAGGVKGSVSATVGAPADIYNLLNQVSFRGQLPTMPYGSEDISKMLPDVIPTQDKSRQHSAEYGENMGSFIPTPMTGQALKGAVKLGTKGAKALGEGLGQLAPSGSGPQTLASQVGAIKLKGGNWFANEVENNLKGLKQSDLLNNIKYYHGPEFEKAREARIKELKEHGNEGALRVAKILEENIEPDKAKGALNQWVDKNLTNYVKNQMGTPDDPVRKLAEEGIVHKPFEDISQFDKDELGTYRAEQGFPPEGLGKSPQAQAWENEADLTFNIKKAKGLQELPEKIAKAELANAERIQAEANLNAKVVQYLKDSPANLNEQQIKNLVRGMAYDEKELLIDDNTFSNTLGKLQKLTSFDDDYNLKRLQENEWINKVAPDTNIYSAQTGGLGFDHILDVLKEDVANGRLRPESLKNVSMEQAVRRTYEYDQEMAKKMAEAQFKVTEGMPVHKEYPEGYKWHELAVPEAKLPEGHSIVQDYPTQSNWKVVPHPEGKGYAIRADNGQFGLNAQGITERKWNTPEEAKASIPEYPEIQEPYQDELFKMVDPSGKTVSVGATEKEALNLHNRQEREQQLADALKYEGDTMGHCVGGYCPDVIAGRSRIFSLRDAKGEPHVTVEAIPQKHHIGYGTQGNQIFPNDFSYGGVDKRLPQEQHQAVYNRAKEIFDSLEHESPSSVMDAFQQASNEIIGEAKPSIQQIKGKQNLAPKEQYLPFVQDFVKSGNWSDVDDLKNTGLIKLNNQYLTYEELKPKIEEARTFLNTHPAFEPHRLADRQYLDAIGSEFSTNVPVLTRREVNELERKSLQPLHPEVRYTLSEMKSGLNNPEEYDPDFLGRRLEDIEKLRAIHGDVLQVPPVEGMKKGGAVNISNNPDTMFMELMDKKMKGGGAEDNTKLTPSQWLQAQGNKPIEPFTPIEDLTANLKAIANLPSRMYEGAKQLVTDPRAYFADMKAPTAEELAMAFNPSSVGLAGMATKVGKLNAIDALFPNKTESMLTPAEKTALTKYKKDLDVPAVMRRELFRTTGTGDIETPSLKMRPEKGLNPDYLENKYVVPILWDTSGAGTNVSQIAGVPLSQGLRSSTPTSVQKQGGRLYPLIEENAQQGVGGASMASAASSKVNNLNTYSSKGPTVGVVMDMAEHGIDFSHHIAEPYIGMLNALRPSNDALKAFKEAIRKTPVINPITGAKVYPYTKFPGIDSPNIRDIIANGTDDYSAGNIRKAIAEVGDTYAMEKLGFPKWSDIYKTMSMPDAKTGQSAKTILEVKPNTQIVTPNFEHGSYNTGMGATYAGGLADVNNNIVGVPDTVLLKKLFDERLAQGKTIGNVRSSLLKSHHGQLMTAEDIARLREYLGYDKPKKKANGGAIKKAKGGEISEDDIQMEVRPL
jgi:hypothetical protein